MNLSCGTPEDRRAEMRGREWEGFFRRDSPSAGEHCELPQEGYWGRVPTSNAIWDALSAQKTRLCTQMPRSSRFSILFRFLVLAKNTNLGRGLLHPVPQATPILCNYRINVFVAETWLHSDIPNCLLDRGV